MLEYFVLIIILLIIIFIGCIYYVLSEREIKLISENTNVLNKGYEDKMISIYSEYININKDKVNVVYYDIPKNCIYWTIGIYNNGECINSVNMGKYHATEKGDTLAILITNNYKVIDKCKEIINKEHMLEYMYKKLITHDIYSEEDYYIKFESFSNNFNCKPKFYIKEYMFNDVPFERLYNKQLKQSKIRQCENMNMFIKAKNTVIDNKYKEITVTVDTNERDSSLECLTNRSDIIDVSKIKAKPNKFRVFTIDHFKSRAALHSHIIFFNAETNKKISIEITGEISDVINNNNTITCRDIKFELPEYVKHIYIIEYIYYDFETGSKINPKTIIPMKVYIPLC